MSGLYKLAGVLLVEGFALDLIVGAICSSNYRSLVDVQSKPGHTFEQIFNRTFNCACSVGIFNAQDKLSSCMACIQPAKESSTEAANVLEASRTGGETQTRFTISAPCMRLLNTVVDLCHDSEKSPNLHHNYFF